MSKELTNASEDLFWYWISERHAIYLRRQRGEKKPWTTDPILRDYKFTNPFRENDRGTVWLRENFLEPHREPEHEETCASNFELLQGTLAPCDCGADVRHRSLLAFNICWYRMFNWWGTGERLGWQTGWNTGEIIRILNEALDRGEQVFTGAHIVYSPPGFGKVEAITDVCADLWTLCSPAGDLGKLFAYKNVRLESVYDLLRTVYCVGGFMAYEMVTDMRHTALLDNAPDIMTWANPGPGAKRGLRRLGLPHTPDKAAIESMRQLLGRAHYVEDCLKDIILGDVLPRFEMRDIEHSLCEFDKYARVKFGEGEPRSKFNGRE